MTLQMQHQPETRPSFRSSVGVQETAGLSLEHLLVILLLLVWAPVKWSVHQSSPTLHPKVGHALPIHLTYTLPQQSLWAILQQQHEGQDDELLTVGAWQPALSFLQVLQQKPFVPDPALFDEKSHPLQLYQKQQLDAP
ncbi:hypothetical protein [Deinococcus cellulosilyticus]|uniref:Uncharacterized protein n=1 Tax=Deinococcus cellulosilyticus (strain DSM 18568 / NBRC 106333 / KACC 11606 / 5516J-15) TaxID=1223518 RepID=A0A511MWA9_DEIC1|nr:hypothetical protein [Deinococcus cellulosilyticus]GEM44840.1 hypothetical protein DC3_04750 [Deinococcus cellulosilyticus NBRC 106333 = KACC 11606]